MRHQRQHHLLDHCRGLGATIYTALGGLKAVIWTDMIQFFVFVGGLSAIWFLLLSELGTSTLLRELGKVPRAYAGNDFEAGWGKRVQLDGSLSRSFDGTLLEFSWRQLNRFTKIDHVHMEDQQTPRPTIVLPEKSGDVQSATLTFALRVTTSGNPPLQSPPIDGQRPRQGSARRRGDTSSPRLSRSPT